MGKFWWCSFTESINIILFQEWDGNSNLNQGYSGKLRDCVISSLYLLNGYALFYLLLFIINTFKCELHLVSFPSYKSWHTHNYTVTIADYYLDMQKYINVGNFMRHTTTGHPWSISHVFLHSAHITTARVLQKRHFEAGHGFLWNSTGARLPPDLPWNLSAPYVPLWKITRCWIGWHLCWSHQESPQVHPHLPGDAGKPHQEANHSIPWNPCICDPCWPCCLWTY